MITQVMKGRSAALLQNKKLFKKCYELKVCMKNKNRKGEQMVSPCPSF